MTDTPLTEDGILEARAAGRLLAVENIQFDLIYTSLLRRSIKTVWLAVQELGQEWVPVLKDWRLNERNYGALVGRNKKQCVEEYGKDQVKRWRRSWDEPPPEMTKDYQYWPGHEYRYEMLGIDPHIIPLAESLKEVTIRTSEFWDEKIVPQLKAGKKILIVGHENNLRSMIKRLDKISNEDILHLELPRAIPLLYHLDRVTLEPIKLRDHAKMLSGKYLTDAESLEQIAVRDQKQVYDLNVKDNLEMGPKWDSWRKWMVFLMGPSYGNTNTSPSSPSSPAK
eukprot:CAMPEP_0182427894 /NCGR_PEP_ID=MMETSP1167-20130531/20638_1 /TAXON_ID=2988 /ORGANISM="Mallomonas Sp, Strain CCMP3275" /LENGTH=280 /DNA_ID=CAMNT_0024610467 /DNA_START=230 /DNA_END=1072 /DNA_ORIENTATION=+